MTNSTKSISLVFVFLNFWQNKFMCSCLSILQELRHKTFEFLRKHFMLFFCFCKFIKQETVQIFTHYFSTNCTSFKRIDPCAYMQVWEGKRNVSKWGWVETLKACKFWIKNVENWIISNFCLEMLLLLVTKLFLHQC